MVMLRTSETGNLRYQFTKAGLPSALTGTVTATSTAPDGTITALSNPTLQNNPADPSYTLDFSAAVLGGYAVKFLTTDTDCDQYPGVVFNVSVGQGAAAISVTSGKVDVNNLGAIADAVWDEALAGHLLPGSTGAALDNAGGGGVVPTVQQIVDGVWDEANSAHVIADSTGANLADILAKVMLLTSGSYTIALQSGFTQSGDIEVTQGQDNLLALGTQIQVTVTGLVADPTGGAFTIVVYNRSSGAISTTLVGTLLSYNAGTAVIYWEHTAAQNSAFNPPNASTPGGAYIYGFTMKIAYPASAGTLIPIPERSGTFKVNFTPP